MDTAVSGAAAQAPHHALPMSDPTRLARLLPAVRGIAPCAAALAVAQHGWVAVQAAGGGWPWAALHLVCAVAAVPLGAWLLDRLYPLPGLAAQAAGNDAAAIQASAHRLAAAAVAAAAWGGVDAASLAPAAAFWAAGVLAVALLSGAHRLVTRYRDHEEVAAGNAAAALASAGLHLAIGIVVAHAVLGDFAGWAASFAGFAWALAWVLLLWPLRQLVLARLVLRLPPRELDRAISGERDLGCAAAEAVAYITVALGVAAWA
jgi:uncharacterized membrane protein YjfL (UPF0719 family)